MTRRPTIVVHPDAAALARAAAASLAGRLIEAQGTHGTASLVVAGGGIANQVYEALRDTPATEKINWAMVDLWWGDERFLPPGHPDRNETQARQAGLDLLPLDPERVHPMPGPGPAGADPGAAAASYATALAAAARAQSVPVARSGLALPRFDLLLLGVGEDGHVASVFPAGRPVAGPVAAVLDSPKPPPVRITLTIPAINTAEEIWLLVAGPAKAAAVRRALAREDLPAGQVQGTRATRWLLDVAAAGSVDQDRADQDRADQERADQERADQDRADQERADQAEAEAEATR